MNAVLIPLTYFFIFFPYVTISGIIDSDVQPFSGVFALIYLILNIRSVKLSSQIFILIFLTLIAGAYNVLGSFEGRQIFKFLSIPYALILLLFINNTIHKIDLPRIAYRSGVVYSIISIFQLLFPALYVKIFSFILRDVKVEKLDGIRGVSALTTEPSFTAFILVVTVAIVLYCKNDIPSLRKNIFYVLAVFSIFLTKSLTGVVLLFIFIAWESLKKANFIYIAFIAIMALLGISAFKDTRVVGFLFLVLDNPLAILSESSLFFRVYYFVFGFVSLVNNYLGVTLGSYSMDEIRIMTDQVFVNHVPIHTLIRIEPSINMPSPFGVNMYLYGVFYAFAYVCMFFPIYFSTKVPTQVKWLIFVLTAQSFSFSFTLLWVLVSASYLRLLNYKRRVDLSLDNTHPVRSK